MRVPYIIGVTCEKSDGQPWHFGDKPWRVGISHDAWCGHFYCGTDWSDEYFDTGAEALEFINGLPDSWRDLLEGAQNEV